MGHKHGKHERFNKEYDFKEEIEKVQEGEHNVGSLTHFASLALPTFPLGITWYLDCDWSTVNSTTFEFTLEESSFNWKRTDFDGSSQEETEKGTWTQDEDHYFLNFEGKERQLVLGKSKPLDFPYLLPAHGFSEFDYLRCPVFVPAERGSIAIYLKNIENNFWVPNYRELVHPQEP
jgi:hypothetical protein